MRFLLLLLILTTSYSLSYSQNQEDRHYTDHKPQYRKWLDSYILDKIEYQPDATVFYFRFVCDNANSGGAVFYPPGGTYAWYLKGKNKNYEITAVKNVRRDGKLIKRNVVGTTFSSDPASETGKTIFSCEVHFGPLDNEMKAADLIEGRGQEYNRRHFNCFDIKLKTWDDETLGNEEDSRETIRQFTKKHNATPAPEPEITTENVSPNTATEAAPPSHSSSGKNLRSTTDISCGNIVILDRLEFQDNSTDFKGMIAAEQTIWLLFVYLRDNPGSTVTLYGHSDIFGDPEQNKDLSRRRAIKVQRWLSMHGINPKRIDCEWFGGEQPLIKEGSYKNRRVEARVQCQ